MFNVEGTVITISRGDTGALRIHANATRRDTGTAYTFGENDRAVFSIKDNRGNLCRQKAYTLTNNAFVVVFTNQDTENLEAGGGYTWDVRYAINAYFDDEQRQHVVDGDQVITPNTPMNMNMLQVVGEI